MVTPVREAEQYIDALRARHVKEKPVDYLALKRFVLAMETVEHGGHWLAQPDCPAHMPGEESIDALIAAYESLCADGLVTKETSRALAHLDRFEAWFRDTEAMMIETECGDPGMGHFVSTSREHRAKLRRAYARAIASLRTTESDALGGVLLMEREPAPTNEPAILTRRGYAGDAAPTEAPEPVTTSEEAADVYVMPPDAEVALSKYARERLDDLERR